MSKRIRTYEDLQEEKQRLEALLESKKVEIEEDWSGIKKNLSPITHVFSFVTKLTHRNSTNPLINLGIDVAGDVFLKKFIFRKADWITRIVLPLFIKNYSSNVLGDKNGNNLFSKLRKIFKKDTQYHYAQGQAPNVPSTGPINPAAATPGPDAGSSTVPL